MQRTGSMPPASPSLPPRLWLRTGLRTAAIGVTILLSLFLGYEVAERLWLRHVLDLDQLFVLHMVRGMSASLIVGGWALFDTLRAYRKYDRAFQDSYQSLRAAMEARTQDLVRAQAFTERLFDAMRDRLIVIDRRGRVVKANRVALEAYGGDPTGLPCAMLGSACSPDCGDCAAREALARGRPVHKVRTDRNSGRIFSVHAYPVPDLENGEDLVIESAMDITEAKQLEAQVRYQEKFAALGVLAAGVAHDIGNPLASMSSELEMLEVDEDPERVKESLKELRGQIARMARTLREMTDFSRRRGEETSEVEVAAAVRDALRMVRHDPRARTIRVDAHLAPELPRVRMVEDHLVMILVNLIVNAFDAMPRGGALELWAEMDPQGLRVSVIDNGGGMSEEVRRRAVEPLFTTKSGGRGTGLGLTVSADIMKSVGGSLAIASEPGVGTTVQLHFPAAALCGEKAVARA